MNGRIVTWLGAPAVAVGLLPGAAPAHADAGVRIDGATVAGGTSRTVNVTLAYSCDAGGFVRSATVIAEDRRSGALGTARFAPSCTGATVTAVVPVTTLNQNGYAAGDPAAVHASLLDGDDTEVLGTIAQLTLGNG
ncbi:hypothetical protein [Streptomyces sp. CBMA123]|uniref:hypothetical protein n=1 Tax=Streptomyces sp. CBMA123 TaxID=1896313 RepID=UPI0016619D8E|nr:hypothetical protein [Streptomyces sp. CBMA123]MBD0689609.1 hypothetical protein [Streptomyces sp. CBMA123]